MSYTNLLYHIIFRTRNSRQTIPPEHECKLYAYINGYIHNKDCKLYRIGGMPDHLHILVDIHPSQSVASFIRQLKESSSRWLKSNSDFPQFDGWAMGYAALTYGMRDKDMIANYIANQKQHHTIEIYTDELRRLLIENGIKFDERYFLRD